MHGKAYRRLAGLDRHDKAGDHEKSGHAVSADLKMAEGQHIQSHRLAREERGMLQQDQGRRECTQTLDSAQPKRGG